MTTPEKTLRGSARLSLLAAAVFATAGGAGAATQPPPPSQPPASAPALPPPGAAAPSRQAAPPAPPAPAPIVDGRFDDWAGIEPAEVPPPPAGALDLGAVRIQSRGTTVYLDLGLTAVTTLQSGPAGEPTAFLAFHLPDARRLIVDMRARRAFFAGQQDRAIPWGTIDWAVMPTYAADRFEVRVDLGPLGVKPGERVLVGANVGKGAQVRWPVVLDRPAPPPPVRRSPARPEGTVARVASLNVLWDGLTKPATSAAMARLLRAAAADVICLQEADKSTPEQVQQVLSQAMGDGSRWNILKEGSNMILSRRPLTALGGKLDRVLAAGVEAGPNGEPALVVLNMHLKCCGHARSAEDAKRVEQAALVAAFIADLRSGKGGAAAERFANAPVVLIGDMNLVGSDAPLRALTEGPGAPLRALWMPHLIGDDSSTWREPSGVGFWPGRLDLALVDARPAGPGFAGVGAATGWVLESAALNEAELKALRLEPGDSASTDHRLLVVDLRPAP